MSTDVLFYEGTTAESADLAGSRFGVVVMTRTLSRC